MQQYSILGNNKSSTLYLANKSFMSKKFWKYMPCYTIPAATCIEPYNLGMELLAFIWGQVTFSSILKSPFSNYLWLSSELPCQLFLTIQVVHLYFISCSITSLSVYYNNPTFDAFLGSTN